MPEKIFDSIESLVKKQQADGAKKRHPRISISTQLFMSVMGMVLVFIITIILVDTRLMDVVYIFSTAWQMWSFGDEVSDIYTGSEAERLSRLSDIEKEYGVSLEIYDSKNALVYYSDTVNTVYGSDIDQNMARKYELVTSGDIGVDRHLEIQRDPNSSLQMEYIVYISTLEDGHTVRAYKMKTPMDEGARIVIQIIVYASIGLIFFAIIVIRIFSKRFTRPLETISETAHAMATLDFSQRCPPARTREIALLADSLNDMSEVLSLTIDDLKQKNKKLQDDYEKEKTLENLRWDFITGVSHELKTPIAIIQGYAEGLELFVDSDVEAAKQYAQIIRGETGRMSTLVVKLLEIIKYDSGDYQISRDVLYLRAAVQDWFDRNSNLLTEKNITYRNEVSENYVGIGDSLLIGSVINNYLSNAVSHVEDRREIVVSGEDLGDLYRIYVFNTGKNIADKDIDKIWDSFYRADKSLSRAEGRFGLGLTIVSSIQKLHNRAFGVENMPDGVRFWFDVEKKTERSNG